MASSCGYPTCVALTAKGREYCTVHRPEEIAKRIRAIVENNFGPAIAASPELRKLRDDILHDLENTI